MNSLSTSHFDRSSFPSAQSSVSPTDTRSQFPFITSTQIPASISSSTDATWLGAGSSSSFQSSLSPTNIVPGFGTKQETRTEVSFQIPYQFNLSLSVLAANPPINPQPQEFINPYSQYPSSICVNPKPVLKEKKPKRPCNAFMLFRSDILKRGLIPKDQEARQHKLSIIAGKCWHKLTKEEKNEWFLQVEREKVSGIKYGGNQSRARAKTRREPKHASKAEELEHFDRLAEIAYEEISNGTPSQAAAGNTTSSATTNSDFQLDKTELPLLVGGSQVQAETSHHPPFLSPSGAVNISVQSSQLLPMTPTSNTFQNADIFRGVGHIIRRPEHTMFLSICVFLLFSDHL